MFKKLRLTTNLLLAYLIGFIISVILAFCTSSHMTIDYAFVTSSKTVFFFIISTYLLVSKTRESGLDDGIAFFSASLIYTTMSYAIIATALTLFTHNTPEQLATFCQKLYLDILLVSFIIDIIRCLIEDRDEKKRAEEAYRRAKERKERQRAYEEYLRKQEAQRAQERRRANEEARRRAAEEARRRAERERQYRQNNRRAQQYASNSQFTEALQLFGLSQPFTRAQLRKARNTLIKKYHPDHGGTNADAIKINTCYDLLKTSASDAK